MTSTQQPVALVVAESDSAWPAWVERWQRQAREVVLIVQAPGEDLAQLGRRVRARVSDVVRGGRRLEAAALVGGASFRTLEGLVAAASEQLSAGAIRMLPREAADVVALFDQIA